MSYGEAASAITIDVDVGHLFKKFYIGFDADILTWLPYDEDVNNELVLPFKFDLNQAIQTKRQLQSLIPVSNLAFF